MIDIDMICYKIWNLYGINMYIQFIIYSCMNTDYSRTMSRFGGHMHPSTRQRIQAVFQEIFFTAPYHQVVRCARRQSHCRHVDNLICYISFVCWVHNSFISVNPGMPSVTSETAHYTFFACLPGTDRDVLRHVFITFNSPKKQQNSWCLEVWN